MPQLIAEYPHCYRMLQLLFLTPYLVAGWATPLKNMSSSLKIIIPNIYSQYMEKYKSHVPNYQPDMFLTCCSLTPSARSSFTGKSGTGWNNGRPPRSHRHSRQPSLCRGADGAHRWWKIWARWKPVLTQNPLQQRWNVCWTFHSNFFWCGTWCSYCFSEFDQPICWFRKGNMSNPQCTVHIMRFGTFIPYYDGLIGRLLRSLQTWRHKGACQNQRKMLPSGKLT